MEFLAMGVINCPVCCDKTFESKQELIEHLSNIILNLRCPVCNVKLQSLAQFIDHLNLDNCQLSNPVTTAGFRNEMSSENYVNSRQSSTCKLEGGENGTLEDFCISTEKTEENVDIGKMYVEILSKQLMKPCLQTQEVKLVKEDGESRYVILTQDSDVNSENTIVTKQNNDGTISLTTIQDMKHESDTLITQVDNEPEDNQEELYSCNTCGVSFSSVIDHIQNYHNDQDVVVEEPIEDGVTTNMPIEYEDANDQALPAIEESQPPRRVITDSGDIIEAPAVEKTGPIQTINKPILPMKEEVLDKQGRVYTRKYVQIDKMCDSLIKDINESNDAKGPYHKVVMKEVQIPSGEKVKVYHCVSCSVYLTSLVEFKSHPCKKLKYPCPHCPVAYENSKSLCGHMKIHKPKTEGSPDPSTLFECEICSTMFPTHKSLKLHKRMHYPIKSRPIEPPVEGESENTDKFLCAFCDKMIPTDYQLIHEASHDLSDKFNCDICNKKFSSKEYLDMHVNVHNLDKVKVNKQDKTLPYTCLYCNRQFARPHEKVKHERIHTGEKPHSCEICGKSFRVSYCLTLHMRTHTGARPYACPHCGKRFKAHSVYNHHLLTHSEVRAYKCPYCPKAFKTSVQLAGHKNSHTKPFSCQQCNRPFASLYAVRVHTETHARQNNLKFSCSLCGASYARAFALKDHIKQVHKQEHVDHTTFKEEDYMIRENPETEHVNNKELPTEIRVIGPDNHEMIIP